MRHYWPKWGAVDAAISKEGWKMVALLRLSPIVPWNVLNFFLAVVVRRPGRGALQAGRCHAVASCLASPAEQHPACARHWPS